MQDFNEYALVTKPQNLGKGLILSAECQNQKDGNHYEVLYIPYNKEYERMLGRILQNEIKPLINREFTGIQKIVDSGILENGDVFIAYEKLNDTETKITAMKDIAEGLNALKKENRERVIISKNNIKNKLQFIGLYEFFKKANLLDRDYLSPNVLEWLDGNSKTLPNFQDDIYSLVKYFEPHLLEIDDENTNKIIQVGLAAERTNRFNKYSDLIDLLDDICLQNREKNLKILIQNEYEKFLPILKEMNKYCKLCIEPRRSKQDQIAVKFCTDNWRGIFYVDEGRNYSPGNYIFIPVNNCEPNNGFKTDGINWFVADFSFSLDESSNFNCLEFFSEKFYNINQLANINKTKRENVSKWQTMPEKEMEFIVENAFNVKYHYVKKSRKTDAVFSLSNDLKEKDWETIKKHKNEGTLFYAITPDDPKVKSDDKKRIEIGKIGEFHTTHKILFIRDISCEPDEIPMEGKLVEDIRQKIGQFKKQVEACQNFLDQKIVNPILGSILANPDMEKISHNQKSNLEYKNFKEEVFNKKLQTDETQLEAVLEAITYKPIYLIQGPPGTGKTTVIVECIRQLIKRQPNVKILITSQSNLAVDNVLERLVEVNQKEQNLKFMRLASESEDRGIKVTDSIIPHTYEKKLKEWVNETIGNSEKFMKNEFSEQENNKILEFYKTTREIEDFGEFKKKLNEHPNNYIKKLFENARTIQNKKEIFENILGKEYLKLKTIQGEWIAFLNNTTKNAKLQSKLNNGSGEIDFLTAMMMDMNVIGATCIHIASSKYAKINFKFDYVIMDESSKASPAETLVPINMGRNIILIGDHKQLPPVVTREDAVKQKVKEKLEDNGLDIEKEFGESLFEKLITAFENDEEKRPYIKMLDIQYRMPKQIGTLISNFFYDKKLKNPNEETIPAFDEDKKHGLNLKKDTSIIFLSTSKKEKPNDNGNKFKRENECNMNYIKEILKKLNELYANNLQKKNPFTIGIIAGYRGQVDLLSKSINRGEYGNFIQTEENDNKNYLIEINTVDKFQGAERDIIIYDIVRSDKDNANIGFLDDYRRINVAFSRAKRLLIIVGDSDYIIERATLNPDGKFPEFKLQQIAKSLKEDGFVFNSLEEIF
jgi:superfamily I DNA and/or RNA helicase